LEPELSTILRTSIAAYDKVADETITAFQIYFKSALANLAPPFLRYDITDGLNLATAKQGESRNKERVLAGSGLYLIASDYQHELSASYKCRLEIDGLPVIYRGQARAVRKRLQGHLFNKAYRERFGSEALDRCLKLDEVAGNKGGINVDEAPYAGAKWVVVVLPMAVDVPIREFAEWGFDNAWGIPVASKETKKNPCGVSLDNA
jgi:hypothetical protein